MTDGVVIFSALLLADLQVFLVWFKLEYPTSEESPFISPYFPPMYRGYNGL